MRASLLIATRNRAAQLAQGLASIRRQGYREVESILVDDNSDDGTAAVVQENSDWLSRVHRIRRDGGYRLNPSSTWNLAHRLASCEITIEQGGEVCHLTNCVDPLIAACRPGLIALARVYHGEPEAMRLLAEQIANGTHALPDDVEAFRPTTEAGRWPCAKVGPFDLYCGLERQAPFLFLGAIHRTDFEALGGYDEARKDRNDTDLANRLIARGARFRFLGKAVAFHLRHGRA